MAPRKYVMDRRSAASEATRLRVIEAAVALHRERGSAATRWADIAESWVCPDCGTPKHHFEMVELSYAAGQPLQLAAA